MNAHFSSKRRSTCKIRAGIWRMTAKDILMNFQVRLFMAAPEVVSVVNKAKSVWLGRLAFRNKWLDSPISMLL